MLKRIGTAVLLLVLASAPVLPAFDQEPNAEAPSDFVSGTVVDMPAGKLVVNRAVVGNQRKTTRLH